MTRGPRLLFIGDGNPRTRHGGAALRRFALRAGLERIAEVTSVDVACACDGACERPGMAEALLHGEGLPARDPFWWFYCPSMSRRLCEAAEARRPDIVIASGIESYRYLLDVSAVIESRLVFDLHNLESTLYRDIAAFIRDHDEYRSVMPADFWNGVLRGDLTDVEGAMAAKADSLWVCTDEDRDGLIAAHDIDAAKVTVVPNVVIASGSPQEMTAPPHRVLFTGRLEWLPNVDAARFLLRELAPRLADRAPWMRVVVAGARPRPLLSEPDVPANAELIADPERVDELWPGSILAVPLRLGSGSRLKILEAFAAGVPVVSSAKGIEGIEAVPGIHYLAAETLEEFTAAVCRLAGDLELSRTIAKRAYDLVTSHYGVDQVVAAVAEDLTARF